MTYTVPIYAKVEREREREREEREARGDGRIRRSTDRFRFSCSVDEGTALSLLSALLKERDGTTEDGRRGDGQMTRKK